MHNYLKQEDSMKEQNEMKVLLEKRKQILKELMQLKGWVTGSLVHTHRTQVQKKKPFSYVSRSVRGKNRITYVSQDKVSQFKSQIEAGKKAKELFEQVSELTIKLIKMQTKGKKP